MKKTVFVHDWIYHLWWAEKVFLDIIKHFIQQDITNNKNIWWSDYIIYTLFSNKSHLEINLDDWYISNKVNNKISEYDHKLSKTEIYNQEMESLLDSSNKEAIKKEEDVWVEHKTTDGVIENTLDSTNKLQIEIKSILPRWLFNIFIWFEKKQVPYLSKIFDYRNLMFFYPILIRWVKWGIKKHNPDRLVISSFAVVKNILNTTYRKENNIQTTLYLHSPYMFLWNHFEKNKAKLDKFISFFYNITKKLQTNWDLKTIYADEIKYNSFYTKSLIDKIYYGKVVINNNKYDNNFIRYPKVDQKYIDHDIDTNKMSDYFIYIWRIVRFSKELEKIVKLFTQNGKKLIIIWSGPDEEYLKSTASENIKFLWYMSDVETKIGYLSGARWCINLTLESFGLVNIESLLCGVPIFGYDKWWTREIIDDDDNIWYLVKDIDHENLVKEFDKFDKNIDDKIYKSDYLKSHAINLLNRYCNW